MVGCGKGLGGAVAIRFARAGYTIAAFARSQASLDAVGADLAAVSGTSHGFYAMDATVKTEVDAAFARVAAELGPVSVLVYNVSESPESMQQTVLDINPDDFTRSFNINALGALLCTQAVLPGMLASPGSVVSPGSKGVAKRGTILYTSTTGAFRSMAKTARLSAGKMALRALSQSVAKEYGKQGVHAVHLRMDCTYESARNKDMFEAMGMGDMFQRATAANKLASIDDLAETFYTLHMQSPMAWTNELDLRPYTEDCKL